MFAVKCLQGTEVVNKEGGFNYYYISTEISILPFSRSTPVAQ